VSLSPTTRRDRDARKKRPRLAIAKSRATPEIYVALTEQVHTWSPRMARAHLRNKRGYVYLCWREGKRVRNFYLGKSPQKSPTTADLELAGAGAVRGPVRRAKNRDAR